MKKRMLSIIMTVSMLMSLSGCGSADFDAAGYTKACLDAAYHEEYEDYVEFVGCTVDEARTDMDQQNQQAVESEISTLDISVTDEQKTEYLTLLKKIEHLTKYEIGQAYEAEKGFEVLVTIYPVNVYEQFINGVNASYQEAADKGELTDETIFPIMLEYLKECIVNVQYKDAVETTLHVTQDSNNIWQISEEEMSRIDELLLPGI